MDRKYSLSAFLAHYFPTFICAFFLACFAISASISLVSSTYFRGDPERGKYSFIVALVLSLLLALSHFVMIRGWSWGVRAIVVFYLVCFLTVLPTYGYKPHPVAYVTGLLFPMLGLLLLNSKRHREMRTQLVEIRRQRELIRQAFKASRRR
jgi:protein-S-isoprenylcysteine O-methyltransferase Ste14